MALPRLDYTPPDYSERISQGLGSAAKVAESLSPAHPLVQQALRRIYGGEDPRSVAIETKFAMARQQQLPAMPSATPPAPQAPQTPRQLRGSVEDVTDLGPTEAVGMRGTMRSSLGPQGDFTGPAEFTGPEEVVTAPRQPPPARGSQPLMSEPARAPRTEAPILNRDLPALMQGAGLLRKEGTNDLRLMELELSRQRLAETQRQFNEQEGLRQARQELARAQASGIPARIEQARLNYGARLRALDLTAMGLDTRRTENFLRGAGPSLEASSGLTDLVRQGMANPEIVGANADYTQRRVAEVLGNLPLLGNFAEAALKTGADEDLTFAQREFKRRAAAEMSGFVHSRYGANLTGHELRLANMISGGQLSIADTLAGMQIIAALAARKARQYQQGYPDVAGRIGAGEPGALIEPDIDRGFLPVLPGEGGP